MSRTDGRTSKAVRAGRADRRRLRKTRTPGVFRRVDAAGETSGYVVVFRVAGRQRKRTLRTYDEARRVKRESETDRDRGELQERIATTFLDYLDAWVERYRGQGRRGFRENTRDGYRRLIRSYAHGYFPGRLRLVDVTTYELARFVDWLADPDEQGKRLGDRTISNIVVPLRAALSTARREGLIRHNPSHDLALPHRDQPGFEEEAKVFSRAQLAAVLSMAPARHRLLLELLAGTGLRISEAIGLQRRHLRLDEGAPVVCVRRAIVKERVEPPKTRHSRREVRLPAGLAERLRDHLAEKVGPEPTAIVFTNEAGGPLDPNNLRRRVVKPLVATAGAPWAAFHTFRHTFASLHLASGTNLLQLSRALGHHSAAFTLSRYTHLLPGEEAPALELPTSAEFSPDDEEGEQTAGGDRR
jgi:integrase